MEPSLTQVSISPMALRDLPRILQIQAECYTDVAPESADSIRAKVVATPDTCFVARTGSEIVAYLVTIPFTLGQIPTLDDSSCEVPETPDCLYIHDLAVSLKGRGVGAGRKLVDFALSHARMGGLQCASLTAVQGSSPYWAKIGFQKLEDLSETLAKKLQDYGSDATYMVLEL